jgi:plastocyanin
MLLSLRKQAGKVGILGILTLVGALMVLLRPAASHAAAGPKTYTVKIDAKPPRGEMWDFMHFFPSSLAVHQGDTIHFIWNGAGGPHTATLVNAARAHRWRTLHQRAGDNYQLFVHDTRFGGDDKGLIVNPKVASPSNPTCGAPSTPCAYTGVGVLNSGIQFSDPTNQPSFDVTVDPSTPVGEYTVLCLLHPGMEMHLYVVAPGARIQSPGQVAADARAEISHAKKVDGPAADAKAQRVRRQRMAGGHVHWWIHAGGVVGGVTADEYLDRTLRVHRGDRITVRGSMEIHNLAFPVKRVITRPFIKTVCEVPGRDQPATSPFDCAAPTDFRLDLNRKVTRHTSHRLVKGKVRNSGILHSPKVSDGMAFPFRQQFTFRAVQAGRFHGMCNVHGPRMDIHIRVLR